MAPRKCFYGCKGKRTLFSFPAEARTRQIWIEFVFRGQRRKNPSAYICSRHFTEDCLVNKAGFSARLVLKDGAVPSIRGCIDDTQTRPGSSRHKSTFKQFVHTGCQTDRVLTVSRKIQLCAPMVSVGTQVFFPPSTKTIATQLSFPRLEKRTRSKGTQVNESRLTIKQNVGLQFPSTHLRGLELAPSKVLRPAKRPCVEFQYEVEEEENITLYSNIRKVTVGEEEKSSYDLNQVDPEPLHIKEEQEEVWTSQGGEHLQDWKEFPVNPVLVKTEDDDEEEKPQSSQFCQTELMKTEDDGLDCGGPELDQNSAPDLQPDAEDKSKDSSETEVSDGDWNETSELQLGLHCQENREMGVETSIVCDAVQKLYVCSECGQRFAHKPHLKTHMRTHTGEKPFGCSFCSKRFSQKGNAVVHMRCHTGEKPLSCPICKKRFRYGGDVSRHMRIHMEKSESQSQPASLETVTHLQPASHQKLGECETEVSHDGWEVSEEVSSGLSSESSPTRNTEKESFFCSDCGKTFSRRDGLMAHMRTHTGEKPFGCSFCAKRFSQKGNAVIHMRCHTGEKPLSCPICKKRFRYGGDVRRHMRTHMEKSESQSQPASLETVTHLQPASHQKLWECETEVSHDGWEVSEEVSSGLSSESSPTCNTEQESFGCSDCGKAFSCRDGLMTHMRTHTGEKPFRCSVCQKHCSACDRHLAWYARLKTHKCDATTLHPNWADKKAPNKNLYSCTQCSKKFSQRSNLRAHLRIHTGEKPFSCSVCAKGFKQNIHLVEHMTIHTGEKLYKCSTCGKGYNKKFLLKNHKCVQSFSH